MITNESDESKTGAATDFLKHWAETYSQILQSACRFTPETLPPELLRQIRTSLFEALAKSWEEFLRSPQFLGSMKQMLDNAVAFRQMTGDFFARIRRETQGVNREDLDGILLAVREMETRLTRRMDELAGQTRARRERPQSASSVRSSSGQKKSRSHKRTAGSNRPTRKPAVKHK
jgi:hypothetical protein